jgi:predicted heme/steroid binding protein
LKLLFEYIYRKGSDRMKKVIVTVACFIILSTSILLMSCSKADNSSNTGNTSNNTTSNSTSSSSSSKVFTADDLKKYNGQNGNPAYVAVKGTVYDVTNAKKWKSGKHENGIVAGVDLTNSMSKSPHGESVLKDVPVVGQLK